MVQKCVILNSLSTSFIPLVSKTINQRKDSYTTKGSFIFPLTLFHSSLHFTCLRLSISILALAPLRAHSLSDVSDYHSISESLIRFTVGGRFLTNASFQCFPPQLTRIKKIYFKETLRFKNFPTRGIFAKQIHSIKNNIYFSSPLEVFFG